VLVPPAVGGGSRRLGQWLRQGTEKEEDIASGD
jgi:hypothetical protein